MGTAVIGASCSAQAVDSGVEVGMRWVYGDRHRSEVLALKKVGWQPLRFGQEGPHCPAGYAPRREGADGAMPGPAEAAERSSGFKSLGEESGS